MKIKGTNHRAAFLHTRPSDVPNTNKMSSNGALVSVGTTCFLMEYVKGDKTDPVLGKGVSKVFSGEKPHFEDTGYTDVHGNRLYVDTSRKPDVFSERKGTEVSLRKALVDAKIPKENWSMYFSSLADFWRGRKRK